MRLMPAATSAPAKLTSEERSWPVVSYLQSPGRNALGEIRRHPQAHRGDAGGVAATGGAIAS
jgi:hypothetical protein